MRCVSKYFHSTLKSAPCRPLTTNRVFKPLPNRPRKPSVAIISFVASIYVIDSADVCLAVLTTYTMLQ
jgi:hypothetical protein